MRITKIEYMQRKDVHLDRTYDMSTQARTFFKKKIKPSQALVLRIVIDDDNRISILFAGELNLKNIKLACC